MHYVNLLLVRKLKSVKVEKSAMDRYHRMFKNKADCTGRLLAEECDGLWYEGAFVMGSC